MLRLFHVCCWWLLVQALCWWRPLWVKAFVCDGLCGWRPLRVKAFVGEGLCGWRPLCVSAFHCLCGLWLYIKLLLLRCWMQWCYLLRFSVMIIVSECYCRCRPFVRLNVGEGLCGWRPLWVRAFHCLCGMWWWLCIRGGRCWML